MKISHKIDFLTCQRHNFHHLLPIWNKIPKDIRGNFYVLLSIDDKSCYSYQDAHLLFYDSTIFLIKEINSRNGILVTSSFYDDIIPNITRPMCFLAHGSGQTYKGQFLHLIARKNYILDLVPNQYMASSFKDRYTNNEIKVIGCPKLDVWHTNFTKPQNSKPIIAISFHFDRDTVPETRSAWPYFKPAIAQIAQDERWKILGHGHPRIFDELAPYYTDLGIEPVKEFDEVMSRANLYICDNSSTIYEFASTDRPVVVLNAPWFRRDVLHGLRFWQLSSVGTNCDSPGLLITAISQALEDTPAQREKRRKAVLGAYAYTDGKASQRAADEIISHAEKWNSHPGFIYPGISESEIELFINDSTYKGEILISKCYFHK